MVSVRNLNKHGLHAPNVPFGKFQRQVGGPVVGEAALWYRIGLSRARWIKLLATEHTPQDAEAAQAAGLNVLVRVKGEGLVYHRDVLETIKAYRGKAQILEIGNEPLLTEQELWTHAWYVEKVLTECKAAAHNAGMKLCIGGWQANAPPPVPGWNLGDRLIRLYNQYDYVGVHCYDAWDLGSVGAVTHLNAWLDTFRGKELLITEYGIAAQALDARLKAARYAAFVGSLPPVVLAAFAFILGGTPDFARFTGGGYDPQGENSYWLDDRAWEALGQQFGP